MLKEGGMWGGVAPVHPLVGQQFGYVRLAALLLDLAGISTEFSGAITKSKESHWFGFTYTLGGVTGMPRGLHARLCHAFLVSVAKMIHVSVELRCRPIYTHLNLASLQLGHCNTTQSC